MPGGETPAFHFLCANMQGCPYKLAFDIMGPCRSQLENGEGKREDPTFPSVARPRPKGQFPRHHPTSPVSMQLGSLFPSRTSHLLLSSIGLRDQGENLHPSPPLTNWNPGCATH